MKEGTGFERAEDVLPGELLADVEHVRTHGTGRQRAVADIFEIAALAEVEREGDDFGPVLLRKPGDRECALASA